MPHHAHRMIVFDDDHGHFGPMTDLRAAFEMRTGYMTTAARICAARPKSLAGYWVPERFAEVVRERADAPVNLLPDEEILLCVNGRWAMPDADLELEIGHAAVEDATGHVVAAHLRRADAQYFLETGQLHERVHVVHLDKRLLYKYPWEIIAHIRETLPYDLSAIRLPDAVIARDVGTVVGPHHVEIHETALIGPNVVFDAAKGPVFVDVNAVIRPGAILCGPCAIGRGSTVLDHALIKANTAIGPMCKVAGEVGNTVFQGYGNKAHDGHLGDAWVGKWANLGAGTTNSNLLNTYGEVSMRVEPDGPRHKTGMTFLGSVIGDHVKTAIGTRIMTGTVIGTGAMLAQSLPPPTIVRRFAWLTDGGERFYRYDKFVDAVRAVMARRGKVPGTAYLDLVADLHTRATR